MNRRTSPRPWQLVARREVVVRITDRAFLIGTLLTLTLILVAVGVSAFLEARSQTYDVTVSSPRAAALGQELTRRAGAIQEGTGVRIVSSSDDAAARGMVDDEKADAWLHSGSQGWILTTRGEAPGPLAGVVETVVRERVLADAAVAAGTTPEKLRQESTVARDQLIGDAARSQLEQVVGFAFVMLFYVTTLIFGMTLAGSVVEEKQSRIVEIIAAAIPVRQLLAGKVIGNTVLAAAQMALYVAVGLVGLGLTRHGDLVPSLSGSVAWFGVFFLAGFVALSCMWAVAGALASRSEDLQSTASPVTMLVVAVFFGGLSLHGSYQVIASYLPPFSAVLMPIRVLSGTAAWWEPLIALALLVLFAAFMIVAGERVYRRALLQTGGRVGLRAAWSAEE
jgi:ABC-2 type transport system permease protein